MLSLPSESFDVVLAAAVLHHLRDDADWRNAFEKIHFYELDAFAVEEVPLPTLVLETMALRSVTRSLPVG